MKWETIFKNYLVDTLEFVKSATGVAITQGQMYVQELIKYEIISNSIYAIILFLISTVAITLLIRFYMKIENKSDHPELMFLIFPLFGILFVYISSLRHADNAIKAYIAPRVVVMEKLQQAIGGM